MTVHGSIAPQTNTPMVALIDIDEPDDMQGSVGLMISGTNAVQTIQSFDVTVAGGNVTAATAVPPGSSATEQGVITVTFRGLAQEESVSVFNMNAQATDFMLIPIHFSISVPALTFTFMSPNGRAWLTEISNDFAEEVARQKFTQIPVDITNTRQFQRRNIPLPGPGATAAVARCDTEFRLRGDRLTAHHRPAPRSFVSRQLLTEAPQSERDRIQNHEQGHMDITSALVAIGQVLIDVAGAGKTGNARTTARSNAGRQAANTLRTALTAMHTRYDNETQNGTRPTEQADWDSNFVKKAMEEWVNASGPDFRVP